MSFKKINLILHFCVFLAAVYVLYLKYLRYLLADNEAIAIAMLNPNQMPSEQPVLFSCIMLLVLGVIFLLLKVKLNGFLIYRLMKGVYGYSLVILLLQGGVVLTKKIISSEWNSVLHESKNLFVEVQANETRLRQSPSTDSKILRQVNAGTLLLLNDVAESEGYKWNRVLVSPKQYAWIVRVAEVEKGVSKQLTKTNKFYFYRVDQFIFIVALFGFVWGFVSFNRKHY